jgi:hypothetical protein
VAAAIVPHGGPSLLGQELEVVEDLLDRPVGPFGVVERGVQLLDVRRMVLVVVDSHRRFIDVWFESVVGVGKRRKFVRHLSLLRVRTHCVSHVVSSFDHGDGHAGVPSGRDTIFSVTTSVI